MLSAVGAVVSKGGSGAGAGAGAAAETSAEIVAVTAAATAAVAVPAQTLGRVSIGYDRFLQAALNQRWLTLVVAFVLFAGSIWAVGMLGSELIPQLTEGEFYFEVKLPEGASLQATDRVVRRMEAATAEQEDIDRYFTTVGSRLISGGLSLNAKAENLGQLNIVLRDRSDDLAEARVAGALREQFRDIPDLDFEFGRPSYFSLKTPVEVIVFGDDLEELRAYSLDLAAELQNVPGLVDVRSSLEAGNPELQVVFDRRRLASLGLDMGTLSETLRSRVQGTVPTRFREQDRQIDVRIRNRELDRRSVEDVRNLVLPGPDGQPIRLLSVAEVSIDRGPAEIHRLQQQRAAVISANLSGRSLGSAVTEVVETIANHPG